MPFIHNYNAAMQILSEIGTGTCKDRCKSVWIRNIRYALKTNTNPLGLNKTQRKRLTEKIKAVSARNGATNGKSYRKNTTLKKYKNRNSPPYPANEHCNEEMKGNDGNLYVSTPNKNNVCSWKQK